MQFFRQLYPLWNHGVAIGKSIKVVVLKFVDVLPDDVAIPVNLNQRRVVATQARDMVFKRRRRFRRFVFRRFGRVVSEPVISRLPLPSNRPYPGLMWLKTQR